MSRSTTTASGGVASGRNVKLLDQIRIALRVRHYSRRTEEAYVRWIRRFVIFHSKRHPAELGEQEVAQFLSDLAEARGVSASTQTQAASALIFLYKKVLRRDIGWVEGIARAKAPRRLPVVLTREEVKAIPEHLHGTKWLVAMLLYGSGLRLTECLQLRVKDLDFGRGEIRLRRGKGARDRVTMLPSSLKGPLSIHLEVVQKRHIQDLACGAGYVKLPDALERKYPSASREWAWQYVFPASRLWKDSERDRRYRHHLHESAVQRAVKEAVRRAGITKRRLPCRPCARSTVVLHCLT